MTAAEHFVIDASVAIKWIVYEEGSDKADLLQGADMAAPALLRIEIANLLRTLTAKKVLAPERAIDLNLFFQSAPVTIIESDDLLERRAMDLALMLMQPAYDCIYLALAERTNRRLITANRQFIRELSQTEHETRVLDLDSLDAVLPGKSNL